MTKNWEQKTILFKLESTYGTDPTPTGDANAMLMNNVSFSPMEGEDVSRELERPYLGAQPTIPTGLRGRIRGNVELAPSGTAGAAPAWGPMLRACGCAETIVADTSVTYNPVSSSHEAGTFYFGMDGTRHILNGCRGSATLKLTAQAIPYIEFDFVGLWNTPTDTANPTVDLSNFQNPQLVTDQNTPTFSLNSVDLVLREASLNLGNQVEPRLLVGSESIVIPTRAETFMARVEAVPLATFDPFALAAAQTQLAASLVHGTGAGKIATLSLPQCQLKRPNSFENAQGITEWPLELTPLPASGNDQWTLALT